MSDESKDIIYIDIDDEITSIIEKVGTSKKKIVALVLPKRATVLQSIVNMRLLKRTSDEAKKHIVLITSESSIMPLAGAVGLYVAKTLQSKPAIPGVADEAEANEEEAESENVVAETDELDTTASVGELAGLADDEDAIEVDNDEPEPEAVDKTEDQGLIKKPKKGKDKKFKIPNFDTFKKKLILGVVVLTLLASGWYVAFFVVPTAKITLKTDTTTSAIDITFNASPASKELNEQDKVVPAIIKDIKKDNNQKVQTTGEKNLGDKAKGTMTVTNCIDDGAEHTVPAGTTFTNGQFNFMSTEPITLKKALFSGGKCQEDLAAANDFSGDVAVESTQGGDQSNLSSRAYSSNVSGISGFGSNMTGGTSKIVKTVAQADIDSAKQKGLEQNTDAVKVEIADLLKKEGYIPIKDTFSSGEPTALANLKVGDEAIEVSAKVTVAYTMLGVQQVGLKKLVENEAKKQVDTTKQTITDDGMSAAAYQIFDKKPNGDTRLSIQSTVTAGAQLNAGSIKQEIAGKRRGEVQAILNRPGIKDIDIKYNPFWVTKVPTKQSKITVIFENANTK